jgi:hypothetical protein
MHLAGIYKAPGLILGWGPAIWTDIFHGFS